MEERNTGTDTRQYNRGDQSPSSIIIGKIIIIYALKLPGRIRNF